MSLKYLDFVFVSFYLISSQLYDSLLGKLLNLYASRFLHREMGVVTLSYYKD